MGAVWVDPGAGRRGISPTRLPAWRRAFVTVHWGLAAIQTLSQPAEVQPRGDHHGGRGPDWDGSGDRIRQEDVRDLAARSTMPLGKGRQRADSAVHYEHGRFRGNECRRNGDGPIPPAHQPRRHQPANRREHDEEHGRMDGLDREQRSSLRRRHVPDVKGWPIQPGRAIGRGAAGRSASSMIHSPRNSPC
jgi:hypothetical protein